MSSLIQVLFIFIENSIFFSNLNQNDQTPSDHQITKYLNTPCSDSKSYEKHHSLSPHQSTIVQSLDLTIDESKNSPKSTIKCSNDKMKEDFSQITLLSNSFSTIVNDKENLNYYRQHTNNHNTKNKCIDLTDHYHHTQENDHFSNSIDNTIISCTSTSQYIQQIQEDGTDTTDKEEYEIRRKRRKQMLPQQNFHFTPMITNNNNNNNDSLMEVQNTPNENELTATFTDCELSESESYQPKIRKLSKFPMNNDMELVVEGEKLNETKGIEHVESNNDEIEGNVDIQVKCATDDHVTNNQTAKLVNQSSSPLIDMNSECNKLISELSQYAIEAFRRSLIIKSNKVQVSLDNEVSRNKGSDDDDNHTNNNTEERIIEQTILKLEPHISELVGQSLRTSIETIKQEMLANLKGINNMNFNENNHSSTKISSISKSHDDCKKSEITNEEAFNEMPQLFDCTNDNTSKYDTGILSSENLTQLNSNIIIIPNSPEEIKQNQSIETLRTENIDHLNENNFQQHLHDSFNKDKSFSIEQVDNSVNLIIKKQNLSPLISYPSENLKNSQFNESTGNDQISITNNHLPKNILTDSHESFTSTTYKTLLTNGLLRFPNNHNHNNLTVDSMNHIDKDCSICDTRHHDSNSCTDIIDLNGQTIHNLNSTKEKFPQGPLFFSDPNEKHQLCTGISLNNDSPVIENNSPPSSIQPTDYIHSIQSADINSTEIANPFILTSTTTSTSSPCNAVTAAAAATALANVLRFPIPFGWPPKTLTDLQDTYGLLPNPFYHWPWKFPNSPCTSKCSDQNTLLQSSSLVNNTMNIIKQLNKVNTESTLNSCLDSKFMLNEENKQSSIMMFNNTTSLLPQVIPSDEQIEAIPLVVRHDRKANKSSSVVNNSSTMYNICSENLTTGTTVTTTTPITTNGSNLFHGPTMSRRRRTKVTDTRLTHPRVSRYPNNTTFSNGIMSNSIKHHHHNQSISQQQSLLQSTSGIIDFEQALNLVSPTSTTFGLTGNQLRTDDKESLLVNPSLLSSINPAKYRNTLTSTSTTTSSSNLNNMGNIKLDDFHSTKYRSENQIHSSGSNNSSPSPISLRLSGNSKELIDHTSDNLKGNCHGNVESSESAKNIDGQLNGADEKLHCLDIIQEYKSFEKMFTKTFRNYPLSLKSNLLNNFGALPTVMSTVSSPTSSTYSPSFPKDINTSLTVSTSTSLSVTPPFPNPSSTASASITSACSSVCSDINERRYSSKFNQICLLNPRLPNSLPPIPPIFFNPTEDMLNNNLNLINSNSTSNNNNNNNNTNNTNKFSAGNLYDNTSIQDDGQERPRQSLSNCFGAQNNLYNAFPHHSSASNALLCKSPTPYSLSSLKSPLFPLSQSLTSVNESIDCNSVSTIANNNNNNLDHNIDNIITFSNLQNKQHRQQQNFPNLNKNQHRSHLNYINKLYDKLNNTSDNLLNIKLDKSLLLNDNFNHESTSGMALSESYQNQLINYSHELRMTTTLTPVHLRKAKLMFFYTRYPNSTLIKMYFPDVKFYKNNTAQLVKWFSNFREFYYIQMEKYARVAISEGIRMADEIHVTIESEIYRALNLHYNRNQQLEVPDHFRIVVEATLREFFNALYTGKDSEQSWKKPIYKVIARMDQPVPEFFKSPNWMDQLADG
ncbi:unnamed protein product [Schistosoma turkestanicum]|nr:unnamed protein product [Schistosoma turkestanicum]